MRFTFVNTLVEIAKKDRDVIVLLGDLGYGMFDPFFNELPEQIINVGIAEQSMTGLAAGLALEGKKVFTYGTCNFPTMRCLEQIRNDCAYQKANVKIVSANCGLAFKAHGMSHYATEDLAVMRALPNVTVVAPADPVESELLTEAIYKQQGTCYLRLGKGAEPTIYKEKINNYVLGKAIKIIEGKKIVFFSTGSITHEVLKAIE
ncbi:MAG: transketolase, partial [Bacteroidales bacterium]